MKGFETVSRSSLLKCTNDFIIFNHSFISKVIWFKVDFCELINLYVHRIKIVFHILWFRGILEMYKKWSHQQILTSASEKILRFELERIVLTICIKKLVQFFLWPFLYLPLNIFAKNPSDHNNKKNLCPTSKPDLSFLWVVFLINHRQMTWDWKCWRQRSRWPRTWWRRSRAPPSSARKPALQRTLLTLWPM